ncbi:paralemmin-3 [Suncus etruscus]|uniref:paralemmin-3 n=1 Tax=Suncus etruscus TaxID=109475 RepID=UPI00210F3EFD|nr:paralemmin-3 [Suncus etruscus]
MALDSHVWAPATPMPMAESALYRQRLEVIAEKLRLQEEIRAAQRELDEEKLRVQRLKRKCLRDRWLMDGAAEESEGPEDPQTPESRAQTRMQNLEDSLFTLQAQLQLLQSASTGALHKPTGRPAWRRQGQRPLSQPTEEAEVALEGQASRDQRTSLPAGLAVSSPASPCEPGQILGVAEMSSSEAANGPCPAPSAAPSPEASTTGAGVVEVVWEGLRASEDCAMEEALGADLESKVEEVVQEAIGSRPDPGESERPSWAREDRAVVEVVWEGLGGEQSRDTEPELKVPLRLPEGSRRSSPEGNGQGGENGSFIWVERVTLNEEWEELGLEATTEGSKIKGEEGEGEGSGGQSWALELRGVEESGAQQEAREASPEVVGAGGEQPQLAEEREGEGLWGTQRDGGEETLGAEETGSEERREVVQVALEMETEGGEELPKLAGEGELSQAGREGSEELSKSAEEGEAASEVAREDEKLSQGEREGGEESESVVPAEKKAGEGALEAEQAERVETSSGPEQEQLIPGEGPEDQAEGVAEAEAAQTASDEPEPEEEAQPPQKKPEDCLEEEAAAPGTSQPPAESQSPSDKATALPEVTPAPAAQPPECQPLLQAEGPRANPSAHPAPTYAPAHQPSPSAATAREGSEASAPKQKTCQCCAVM